MHAHVHLRQAHCMDTCYACRRAHACTCMHTYVAHASRRSQQRLLPSEVASGWATLARTQHIAAGQNTTMEHYLKVVAPPPPSPPRTATHTPSGHRPPATGHRPPRFPFHPRSRRHGPSPASPPGLTAPGRTRDLIRRSTPLPHPHSSPPPTPTPFPVRAPLIARPRCAIYMRQVVHTTYNLGTRAGKNLETYQYTVNNNNYEDGESLPAAVFSYDMSPMQVVMPPLPPTTTCHTPLLHPHTAPPTLRSPHRRAHHHPPHPPPPSARTALLHAAPHPRPACPAGPHLLRALPFPAPTLLRALPSPAPSPPARPPFSRFSRRCSCARSARASPPS